MVGHKFGGSVLMLDGKWRSNGWTCFGHGRYGYGTFEMLGGTFTLPSGALGIGSYGGLAHMYIGGTSTADIFRIDTGFCVWGGAAETTNAYGVLTIDGRASVKASSTWFGAATDSLSIINLNGGQFVTAPAFFNGVAITNVQQFQSNQSSQALSNQQVYVNFNGGTLQFTSSAGTMNGTRIGRKATIYRNGAHFNMQTAANAAGSGTFAVDLRAPTGKGVGSIPIPAVAAWEFTGSPLVKIDGDGWGASAFAQFDAERGLVTNIVVTSPGCDYTWAKATFYRGGRTNDTEVVITDRLVDNDTSGGVHWFGNGTYNVSSSGEQTSTYCGPTRVSTNATVKYWSSNWHYPVNSPLVMDGGTCWFGSGGFTNLGYPVLSGLSGFGEVHANTITTTNLVFDAAALVAGKTLDLVLNTKLVLSVGTTIRIENAELLAARRAERFTLLKTNDGAYIENRGAIALDTEGGLAADWKLYVRQREILLGYGKKGFMLSVR